MLNGCLAESTAQLPTAQDMLMNMINNLPALGIAISDNPEALPGNALFTSNPGRRLHHMPEDLKIFFRDFKESGNMFFRNHQYMDRGLRIHILEGENQFVFIYYLRRYLFLDKLAENAIAHSPPLYPPRGRIKLPAYICILV